MTHYLWVRRYPTGTAGKVPLDAFSLAGWGSRSGGLQRNTPGYFIFGYISCEAVIEGNVAHSGSHGWCPHRIKVCVTRSGNDPVVFEALASRSGSKPHFETHAESAIQVITAAGPNGATRQDLLRFVRFGGGYWTKALRRLVEKRQVALTTETRPNSIGRPQPQHVYRLADSSP